MAFFKIICPIFIVLRYEFATETLFINVFFKGKIKSKGVSITHLLSLTFQDSGKKIEFSVGDKDFEVDEYGIFRTPGIELRIKKLQIDYDGTHYDVRVIDVKGDRTHYKSLDAEQYATVSPQ